MTQTIGFFGYSSWAPTLLAQEGFSVEKSLFYVALTTVGAPLGCFLAALVTDRFERKWCLVAFGAIIAICGLFYGLTFNPIMIVVVRLPGELLRARLHGPRLRLLPGGVRHPRPGRWAPRSPTGWAGCPTPSDRSSSPPSTPASGYQSVFYFIAGTWLFGAIDPGPVRTQTPARPGS